MEKLIIRRPNRPTANRKNCGSYCGIDCSAIEIDVLDFLKTNPDTTHESIADEIGKSIRTAQSIMRSLKEKGLLIHEGSRNNGRWLVKPEIDDV